MPIVLVSLGVLILFLVLVLVHYIFIFELKEILDLEQVCFITKNVDQFLKIISCYNNIQAFVLNF